MALASTDYLALASTDYLALASTDYLALASTDYLALASTDYLALALYYLALICHQLLGIGHSLFLVFVAPPTTSTGYVTLVHSCHWFGWERIGLILQCAISFLMLDYNELLWLARLVSWF